MIDIKIDLVPFGVEESRRTIAGINIANNSMGDKRQGYYKVTFADGMVLENVGPHDRADDIYCLLYLALQFRMDKQNEQSSNTD